MADILKAAFVFLSPEADPAQHRQWVKTPAVHIVSVAVRNYAQAVEVSKALVRDEGIQAIELCGAFGHRGVAMISDAVGDVAAVGAVRFDRHPGLNNASGDTAFA